MQIGDIVTKNGESSKGQGIVRYKHPRSSNSYLVEYTEWRGGHDGYPEKNADCPKIVPNSGYYEPASLLTVIGHSAHIAGKRPFKPGDVLERIKENWYPMSVGDRATVRRVSDSGSVYFEEHGSIGFDATFYKLVKAVEIKKEDAMAYQVGDEVELIDGSESAYKYDGAIGTIEREKGSDDRVYVRWTDGGSTEWIDADAIKKLEPSPYKIGDRFEIKKANGCSASDNSDSKFLEITGINSGMWIYKITDSDGKVLSTCSGCYKPESVGRYLVLVQGGSMATVNPVAKSVLSADTQALMTAGYINERLELTDKAREALWVMVLEKNQKALVALAEAEVAAATKTA